MVYKNWDIFSKKYVDMLKWFYLVYLNYDMLKKIPPVVGVMEINLLSLHKIVDNLGGYMCVTLGDKWKTVAGLQAKKPWYEKKPKEDVVKSSSGNARVKDPQGKEKDNAGKEEAPEEDMNMKTHFGVRLVGNMEEEAQQGSITDSNDFEVIVQPASTGTGDGAGSNSQEPLADGRGESSMRTPKSRLRLLGFDI
ncbi:ARID DNA-binding domain-containing protein [Tanacetum coccineum]